MMLHVGLKRKRIRILYVAVAALIVGGAFSSYAQLSNSAYTVKTVHIFPSEITSEGFENAETLTFQNLDEYALLQDFNDINSAALLENYKASPSVDDVDMVIQSAIEAGKESSVVGVVQEEVVEGDPVTEAVTESVEQSEVMASGTDLLADDLPNEFVDEIQNVETDTDEALTDEVEVQEVVDDEPESVVETPAEEEFPEVEVETATTTVLRRVDRLFALAVLSLTETFSSTSATTSDTFDDLFVDLEQSTSSIITEALVLPKIEAENVVFGFSTSTDLEEPEEDEVASDAEVNEFFVSDEETDQDLVLSEVATTSEQQVVATTTESVSEFELQEESELVATSSDCGAGCSGHLLRLNNFGYPLDEGVELSGAQLRMSFAAKKKESRDEVPVFTVNYSLDGGQSWSTGGSIVIDDEVSNSINGGYYLFALPAITDPTILSELQVELRYDGDPGNLEELYVESVWLELFTLEPPAEEVQTPFVELLADDGYQDTKLAGDTLALPDGEEVEFTFTDDNEDETLIIKSDQKKYNGLSEATTYFSVTNTSDQVDDFTVQTYFPQELGEVTNLQVFNLNKPRDTVVPEYRPYVYHCEAGWAQAGASATAATLADLSIAVATTTGATSTAAVSELATTSVDTVVATNSPQTATSSSQTGEYLCQATSVIRSCEVVEGEGTACIVSEKVRDHDVTTYAPGWDRVDIQQGEIGSGGVFSRIGSVFGFGPNRKDVPDSFEGEVYTDDTFSIAPGETRYFKMDIAFPPFSSGEYWIEVVGDSEYGLLDPFWSSDWTYRTPIQVTNPTGQAQTEFQVRLQLDSSIADFWNDVDANGDDIRFVQEITNGNLIGEAGPGFENTYDPAWLGRLALTIPSANVASNLTDFPVYVDLSTLGPAFWAGVQSDGRDIRITQSNGATEVPYEIVSFDAGLETGELYFRAPAVSGSLDTTFHIYYNNPAAIAYTPTDPFGSQNVWTNNYEAVYHLENDLSVTNTFVDSTGNYAAAIADAGVVSVTGLHSGNGADLSGNNFINLGGVIIPAASDYTYQQWINSSNLSGTNPGFWRDGLGSNGTEFNIVSGGTGDRPWIRHNGANIMRPNSGFAFTTGVTHSIAYTIDSGNSASFYADGVQEHVVSHGSVAPEIEIHDIGRQGGEEVEGSYDEIRISTVSRNGSWLATEYANQSAPTTFYATSTNLIQEVAGVGWYSTSWNSRQLFTVNPAAVTGSVTDFPVYLDLSVLGPDFFAAVAADGSDIRITTNDAVTELPFELVNIDTGAQTGELYFKTDLTGGEEFYIYFENEDASAYARDDTYGSENVWTNGFQAVYHFEEEAAGTGNVNLYQDSTANEYHGDDDTTDTDTTGRLGQGVGFGNDVGDVVKLPNEVMDGVTDHSVSWWHNTTQFTTASIVSAANLTQNNEFLLFFASTQQLNVYFNGPAEAFVLTDTVGAFNNGTWQHYMETGQDDIDEVNIYVNGQGDTENPDPQALAAFDIPTGGLVVGQEQDNVSGQYDVNQRFIGQLDELRFATVVRDASWAKTEYDNIDNPAAFVSTSSVEALTATEIVELDYWLQYWDSAGEEADVWVQLKEMPAGESTIYMYYGNGAAPAGSSEEDTFSYDTLTEVFFVVDDHGADSIEVTSLVDNNQVQLDGGSVIDLQRGETTSIANPDGSDGLSVLGPVSAVVAGAGADNGDMLVPISFATTTFAIPTNRSTNVWYAYAPFADTSVSVYEGASGVALGTATVVQDTAGTFNNTITISNTGNDGNGAIVEGNNPILVTHRATGPQDGLVAYPPTTEDLYGIISNSMHFSGTQASADMTLTCSAGAGGTLLGVTRGDHEADTSCTAAAEGAGSAVRVSAQTGPVSAVQQADSDGGETTVFWPEIEFGTRYGLPNQAAYVAVVCAPRYGSVDIEIQSALGATIESATCTPGVTTPGKAYFTNGTGSGDNVNFAAGTQVVSTNGIPFYAIFEDVANDQDEKNIQTMVQARKYGGSNPVFQTGVQEEVNGPAYEQLSFAWYQNSAAITPTSTWALGGSENAVEGQAISGAGAVDVGDVLRLRMNVLGSNATITAGTQAFSLQYAPATAGMCNAVSTWYPLGGVGSSTAAFAGYNNSGVSDGTTLATTTLASSTVAATYEERNLTELNPVDIAPGQAAEWDWAIVAENIDVNQTYCFRMIRSDGLEFDTYTTHPELETVGPPNSPTHVTFFDNEKTVELTPALTFFSIDIAGDDIHYEVQIDDNADFSSVEQTRNSAANFLDFTNLNNPSDKAPFTSGSVVRYDGIADLAATTTYYWRVRASDPDGSATSSAWSAPFSYTIDTTLPTSEWFQTTSEQFLTNEIDTLVVSAGSVTSASGNGSIASNPVDFDDAVVGNAWGEAFWSDTETSGEILVQVQYNNNGSWQPIPNSEIPGNNLGTTTSPINLLQLDTNVYNELRLLANFTGPTLSLDEWGIRWALRIETPVLGDLFDNQETANTLPVFDFVSNDPQGDDIEYEISFSTDRTFESSSSTFNSAVDPGFTNVVSGGDTSPFNSSEEINYQTQAGAPFVDGQTYWWRARAKDVFPGGDVFSPWSVADSFTINSATTLSTWSQTTTEQFDQGFLEGTQTAAGSVEISTEIGEYGTVDLTGNTWVQIPTTRTYRNMVVIASSEFDFSFDDGDGRTARVRNKTSNSFELKVDNHLNGLSGPTTVDYIVVEAGDWLIDDGGAGVQLLAGTLEDVTAKQVSTYANNVGETITFPSNFGTNPAGFVTISSNNDSDWVDAHMDGGGNRASAVGPASMRVALAIGNHTASVHAGPEDIDYVVVGTGTGTVDGDAFESLNTPLGPRGFAGPQYQHPLTGFTSAPAVTIVQNNGETGGQGGFAFKDLQGTNSNTSLALSVAEIGVNADGHIDEVVSVLAFEDTTGIISRVNDGTLSGEIAGEDIIFSDGAGPKFDNFSWLDTTPGSSVITYQMQYRVSDGVYALLPDVALPSNSTGFTTSPIDLTSINIDTYDQIRPFATLQCVSGDCPTIDSWKLEWSEGVNMSGTLQEYDRVTNVATGTISASVNGGLPITGGTVTNGVWTLNNVTAFAGDVITVWVDGAQEAEEAVSVFVYDGLGDISGVKLYEQHLAIDSDEFGGSLSNQQLGLYDNSDDEDIMFSVDGLNNLNMCASGTCTQANMYVGSGQTYIPATSTAVTIATHDFINNGTIELDGNTFNVSGSWDNNATSTTDTSTINMTAATGTESVSSTENPLDFHTLSFGGFGMATFTIDSSLDLSGDLTVATGTLLRDGLDITLEGSLSTEFGGVWDGIGTTTFDGSGGKTWSDGNTNPQNIGNVIIDGPSTIVTAVSDVAAYDIFIGANDTFVGGTDNTIYVAGDWTNTGTFTADSSIVEIVPDDREYPGIVPGSADWYSDTAFDKRVTVTVNSTEVDDDLVDYPLYVDLSSLDATFWSDVQSDGRDIRVTTADGQTELPHDLVWIDSGAQEGELHVLTPNISSTTDTMFYVYFDNPAATAYETDNTYGSEAVWVNYEAVYHFEGDPIAGIADVSGNNRTLYTTLGTAATTSGQLGQAIDTTTGNVMLEAGDWTWTAGDDLMSSGLYFMNGTDNGALWQFGDGNGTNNGTYLAFMPNYDLTNRGRHFFGITSNAQYSVIPFNNTVWHHFTTNGRAADGEINEIYEDAILRDVVTQITTSQNPSNTGLKIGRYQGSTYSQVMVDELRFATTTRPAEWIESENTNHMSPGVFYNTAAAESYTQPTVLDEATHVITAGGSAFNTLRFNDATTSPSFADASVLVNDDFIIATGTVALPTGVLTVGGSFLNSGFFMHNNAEIQFVSNSTETIQLQGTQFLNALNNVTFDGSGDWTFTDVNATTSGTMSIEDGTVVFPSGVLTIGETLDVQSPGAFTNNSGTVRFISDSSENIRTAGSAFNDVVFGDGALGWYGDQWSHRVGLTVDEQALEETLTDFPLYVNLADLGADFWANVAADGVDIRVTTVNGETEVPHDLVSIDTTAQTGELHFLAPILSDVSSTTYYVYVGNDAAEAYQVDSQFGAENVWQNYEAVYHFESEPTAGVPDMTGNGRDLTIGFGAPTTTAGQLGLALDTTAVNAMMSDADWTWTAGEDLISSGLYFQSALDNGALWQFGTTCVADTCIAFLPWYDNNGVGNRGYNRFGELTSSEYGFTRDNTVWHHFTTIGRATAGEQTQLFEDNILRDAMPQTVAGQNPTQTGLQIGRYVGGTYMDIQVDELRFATTAPSTGWIDFEYKNLTSSETLYSVASEQFVSGITSFTLNEAITNAQGDVTLQGARLVAPTDTLFIGGSAFNTTGVYDPNNATTTFNSTDLGESFDFGDVVFYNLSFDGVGGGWTVSTTTVANDLTLATGASYVQATGTTMTVGGVFSNQFASAATDWTDSTLVLTGGDYTVTDRLDAGDDYATVQVSGDTDIVIWNSTISTSSILDNSSIYMPDFAGIDGQLNIYGDYQRLSGNEYWSYATDFDGTDLTGGSERQANVFFEGGTSVLMATGTTLQIIGVDGATSTLQSLFGIYSLALQNAALDASRLSMEGMAPRGLELLSGTVVGTLSLADFAVAPGRTGITVDAATLGVQPSSAFSGVSFATSSESSIYQTGWTDEVLLTVNASEVDGAVTNFPVYVDLSTLGPAFWNGVQADGDDIRVTTDLGQEVPVDLASIDTGVNQGELHFLAPSLSNSEDTTFYIHYGNPAASAYSPSSQYGAYAVWSEYEAVYHLNEDPTGTTLDMSGNGRNLTPEGGMTIANQVNGQIGNAVTFDGINDGLRNIGFTWEEEGVTVSFWNNMAAVDVQTSSVFGFDSTVERMQSHAPWNNSFIYWDYGLCCDGTLGTRVQANYAPYLNKWSHVVLSSTGNANAGTWIYLDSSQALANANSAGPSGPLSNFSVGTGISGSHGGAIDEFRITGEVRSQQWISAEYSNQFTPTVFYATTSGPTQLHNITTEGVPTTFWAFSDGVGNLYGEAFDNDDGDPGSIQWDDSDFTISISGTVYADDGVTPQSAPVCNGSTQVVTVVVGGSTTYRAACNPNDGSYEVAGITYNGEPKIVAYIESSAPTGQVNAGLFDSSSGSGAIAGNIITMTRPLVEDDAVLVAIVGKDDDNGTFTPPFGWTQISVLPSVAGDQMQTGAWYRVVSDAGTEPLTYDFGINDNGESYSWWMGSLSNVDTSTPIDVASAWTNYQNEFGVEAPSVTTVTNGSLAIAAWFVSDDDDITLANASWSTSLEDLTGADTNALSVQVKSIPVAGPTGDVYANNVETANEANAAQFVFRPAAAVTASGSIVAAAVTKTPIGSGVSAYKEIFVRDQRVAAATIAAGANIPVSAPMMNTGDVLVAIVGKDDDFSITAPAGWIKAADRPQIIGSQMYSGLWYKEVTDAASEPATYNFINNDSGSEETSYWIASFANVDATNVFDVAPVWSNEQNTSAPTAPSITTVTPGTYVIAAWNVMFDNTVTMPGGAWETLAEDVNISSRALNVAGQRFATAGATGDATMTDASTDDVNVGQFALRPAPAAVAEGITDLDLYQNRVIVRHEDITSLSIADMNTFDSGQDSDLPFIVATTGPDTLTIADGAGLYVWHNKTFAPDGLVTLAGDGDDAADGSLAIGDGATYTSTGTNPIIVGGSFTTGVGATFDGATSLVSFTAATSGQAIASAASSTINFYDIEFTGSGDWAVQTPIVVDQDIHVQSGLVTGVSDITVTNGDFYGDGLVDMTGGTALIATANTLGGANPWTFNNLTLGDGATGGITVPASTATTTVRNQLRINSGHFLDAFGSTWDLAGTGTVFIENGTFLEGTSTVRYSGVNPTILRTAYNNLVIDTESGGSVSAVAPSTGLQVLGDLTVGALGTSTLDIDVNDPLTAVGGDVYIGTLGTVVASDANTLNVFGSWDNDGAFVANGGLVEFLLATGTATIAAGASEFADLTIAGNSNYTMTQSATATGNMNLGTGIFTLQSGESLAVGGVFTNGMDDFNTSWAGTTLRLYGSQAYTINTKDVGDTYNIIEVSSSTHPRFWNSTATTIATESGSSLYSMDHADVAGDLYIFGDFVNTSYDDHWSYGTDWDGAVLGVPRVATVQIEDTGSVLYVGGSLTALGSTTATTTIAAQGAGPYSLTLGGTTTLNLNYYSVRDVNANGVVLTGTPDVTDLSYGDFLVTDAGGSAMTVGGTVISANTAQNFTGNSFATTTAIGAFNVTATGTAASSWRFVNVAGNLGGEVLDNDPGGDPGYVVWEDSAAIIDITGNVYENDRTTVSSVCDGVTNNIRLSIQGLTFASTTCDAGTGAYTIPNIGFGPSDTLTVYIAGEADQAANVTRDPISLINSMDLYENHVIVRHESGAPMDVAAMAVYDSSDDSDIPFTAVDAATDTLTLPADFTLVVWDNMTFAPAGDVTIAGGGGGASYDGSLELFTDATFDGGANEVYSIGGDLISGTDATFDADLSTTTFTSAVGGRTIDTNDSGFHNLAFTGAGAWTIVDAQGDVNNDLTITAGTLTLPAATTTISGSFTNSGGAFDANNGTLFFDATDSGNDVTFGGSDAHEVYFSGPGTWVFGDVAATTTASFVVATGTVTLPSGTLTVTNDFIVTDSIAHNSGTVRVVGTSGGNVVTLGGNDLHSLLVAAPAGDYTLTDASAALLGSLTITGGTFTSGVDTVSIGGSFDASGGVFNNASGTLLFNSADGGEFIDPGANDLYNVVVSGAGGWSLADHATTTNNFSLLNAGTFSVAPGSVLYVGNVFTNDVGGAATSWTGTTLFLDGQNEYETGAKTTATELYDTLVLGENTDISSWNSSATTVTVPASSSWYSQDHAGADGQLNIYGDYHVATTTEYWNATTDFDGTAIGSRPVSVQIADGSTITLENTGTLNIVGTDSATTTIANQGAGTFTWLTTGGTLNANYYDVTDMDSDGLQILGNTTVTSLSNGLFTQTENSQNLITLLSSALNANASLVVTNTGFATGGFTGGVNVSLDATTTNSWSFTVDRGDLWGEDYDVDGIDQCSSIRWDDSSCLLTEQTNYRWRNDDGGEGAIDATWFDTNWSKRQRVRVINDDAMAYASTAVKFVVPYDADMRSNFDDLRVTAADGTTLVNHWIERVQAGVQATVWLQAPDLPAETVSEFFLYYGNVTAATASDADSVFSLVEDFEANDLTPYGGDTGLFDIDSTFAYGGANGLDTDGNETQRATDGMARDDITVSQGDRVRFMQYIDTGAGSTDEVCTLFATQDPVTNNENYAICVEQPGIDRISLVRDVADTEFSGTILASSTATFSSGWYEFNIDWQTDGDMFVTMSDDNGVEIATMNANDTTYTTGGIGFTFWFQHGGWDSYVAWPRTDTIPVVYVGDEQEDGGATWANAQNTPTGGFLFGETARLRVGIENTGLPIENQNFQLEFAPKLAAPSCEAVSTANFVQVPNIASCGSSAVCMNTSANVSDGDVTTDHLVTMAGDFVAGEVVTSPSNQTASFDLAQNRYTELEYALQLTINASNDAYCFRVTDSGNELDSYANLPELTLAFDPVLDPVVLNEGLDIALTSGGTTTIIASTTVTDLNGIADLDTATTTFYKTSSGAACSADDNNCYIATSTCTFSNCGATSCTLQCTADFQYHTDPTDLDGGEEWFAFMEVRDLGGSSDFGTSPGVELLTLRAMDVQNAIAYGTVDISSNTGTVNPNVTLLNIGNESIDVQISGTDMTDGVTSVIPAAQQLFATSTFDYTACIGCSALTVTGANVEVDLNKPTTTTPGSSDDIYWGIEVPFGTASNPHTGLNTFTAIAD